MSTESTYTEGKSAQGKDGDRLIVFSLNKEDYAIPLLRVKEVIGLTEITPIPYSPPHFKGIMNLREQVISIVDLRLKFGIENTQTSNETSIIILDLAPVSIGVIVDNIDSVLAVEESQIAPPPDIQSQVKSDYLTGVARIDKKLILLLDVERALNFDDLKAVHERNLKLAA